MSSPKHSCSSSESQVLVDVEELAKSMSKEIEELNVLSDECCIYRVPPRFRNVNDKAFTPTVVSIGPYHHGDDKLKGMEDHKRRYLYDFLKRCNLSLGKFMEGIVKNEQRLRNSYAETIKYSSREFLKMTAIDGAFVIEYLLKRYFEDWSENDRIFSKQRLSIEVRYDLLLLENQLPWFFLDYLLKLLHFDTDITMIKLVNWFLKYGTGWKFLPADDLLRQENLQVHHFVDFQRICLFPEKPNTWKNCQTLASPTISQLHLTGVKFKLGSSKCLFDIKFSRDQGILEIPKFEIKDGTEAIFRNIQVFEQCHNCKPKYVGDYITIMDQLLNNAEDVELLVKKGIIENWLEDNRAAAQVVNNLGKENLVSITEFYFTDLIEELNAYTKMHRHKWRADLEQKYFHNPWTIFSVIAAVFLLLLTVIQTVCSILQVI